MKFVSARSLRGALIATALLSAATVGRAQFAYGVDASGTLFSLDLAAPATTSTIGNLGFVPEGIDFRPGTSTLFAIDVGPSVSRLYTVDLATGAATGIGAGFATTGNVGGLDYSLAGAASFGFDFNPTTLQPDGSIRIRLTASNGTNLRLHSATGGIAAVDGGLSGTIGGVAYINTNIATIGGVTALYDIDYQSDSLFLQNPPNAGTLNLIGALNFNVGPNLGFDIFTNGGDATILGDTGYFVNTTGPGSANLYSLNLGTGAATPLAVINRDFTGGFAIAGAVPEPSTYGLGAAALLLGVVAWKRRAKATAGS
jgi:hypothetical protein